MGVVLPSYTLPDIKQPLNACEIEVSGWAYYVGDFVDARKEGHGREMDEDGEIFTGTYEKGCRKEGFMSRIGKDRVSRETSKEMYEVYQEEDGSWSDRLVKVE